MSTLIPEERPQRSPSDYEKEFGGDLDVYVRICSLTGCPALQREFDQAEEESWQEVGRSPRRGALVGYMTAVSDRMEVLRCSGDR